MLRIQAVNWRMCLYTTLPPLPAEHQLPQGSVYFSQLS